jgi:hypothetical protein
MKLTLNIIWEQVEHILNALQSTSDASSLSLQVRRDTPNLRIKHTQTRTRQWDLPEREKAEYILAKLNPYVVRAIHSRLADKECLTSIDLEIHKNYVFLTRQSSSCWMVHLESGVIVSQGLRKLPEDPLKTANQSIRNKINQCLRQRDPSKLCIRFKNGYLSSICSESFPTSPIAIATVKPLIEELLDSKRSSQLELNVNLDNKVISSNWVAHCDPR